MLKLKQFRGSPIRQIAYLVEDIRTTAINHSRIFGSGPYFILDMPALKARRPKDEDWIPYDITAALGMWGDIQVELFEAKDVKPNLGPEVHPRGSSEKYGIHHVLAFVDDVEAAASEMIESGFPEAMRVATQEPCGMRDTIYMDTVKTYGYFTELYEPHDRLVRVYDTVAAAAVDWDGNELFRTLDL